MRKDAKGQFFLVWRLKTNWRNYWELGCIYTLEKIYSYSVKVYGQHWAKTTNKNENVLIATSLHIIIHKLTTVEVRRQ